MLFSGNISIAVNRHIKKIKQPSTSEVRWEYGTDWPWCSECCWVWFIHPCIYISDKSAILRATCRVGSQSMGRQRCCSLIEGYHGENRPGSSHFEERNRRICAQPDSVCYIQGKLAPHQGENETCCCHVFMLRTVVEVIIWNLANMLFTVCLDFNFRYVHF